MIRLQGRRGFTLIELLVSVAILSVLAAVALPLAELTVKRNKENELRSALRDIRDAIDAYKRLADQGRVARAADESGYPRTLDILVEGVEDLRSPSKARVVLLRRLPRDPMHPDHGVAARDTWGLRSYASTHDAPQAGRDVFDIYSLAPGVGLNGIAYREW